MLNYAGGPARGWFRRSAPSRPLPSSLVLPPPPPSRSGPTRAIPFRPISFRSDFRPILPSLVLPRPLPSRSGPSLPSRSVPSRSVRDRVTLELGADLTVFYETDRSGESRPSHHRDVDRAGRTMVDGPQRERCVYGRYSLLYRTVGVGYT